MSKIIISNGYLYKDGVKQVLEHGNVDQIKALRDYEKRAESFAVGLVLEPTYSAEITASVNFRCLCGQFLCSSSPAENMTDIDCFAGDLVKCGNCGRTFKLTPFNKQLTVSIKK